MLIPTFCRDNVCEGVKYLLRYALRSKAATMAADMMSLEVIHILVTNVQTSRETYTPSDVMNEVAVAHSALIRRGDRCYNTFNCKKKLVYYHNIKENRNGEKPP